MSVLGIPPDDPERLFSACAYCTCFEAFPPGVTGRSFLEGVLSLRGEGRPAAVVVVQVVIMRDYRRPGGGERSGGEWWTAVC